MGNGTYLLLHRSLILCLTWASPPIPVAVGLRGHGPDPFINVYGFRGGGSRGVIAIPLQRSGVAQGIPPILARFGFLRCVQDTAATTCYGGELVMKNRMDRKASFPPFLLAECENSRR